MQGSGFICWGKNGYFPLCVASVRHWECAALISFLSRRWDFRGRWGYLPGAMMGEDWGLVWASEFMWRVRAESQRGYLSTRLPSGSVFTISASLQEGHQHCLARPLGRDGLPQSFLGCREGIISPLFLPHMDLPHPLHPICTYSGKVTLCASKPGITGLLNSSTTSPREVWTSKQFI